jgi:aspartyl-tRNA(Asn)/glutamyl-tRNA(Gln) amidotransferase subunit C
MEITKAQVQHVAHLARLELDEEAIDTFAAQISEILQYVDKLQRIDTEGIAATSHAISLTNAFRDDEERAHLQPEAALANAPAKEEGSFVVPKIIESS